VRLLAQRTEFLVSLSGFPLSRANRRWQGQGVATQTDTELPPSHPMPSHLVLIRPRSRFAVGVALSTLALVPLAHALKTPERVLRPNMQVEYVGDVPTVEHLKDTLAEGRWYARARVHGFDWDWREEKLSGTGQTRNNAMIGSGGSLIWKSARWRGFSATLGGYATVPLHDDNTDSAVALANFGRAGKDTYRTRADGTEAEILVLAEASVEWRNRSVAVRAGRQIIDSALLSSNDTKMIPNTFEALRLDWKGLPRTVLTGAVVGKQKLRDHSTFHSLLAYERLTGNDDSGSHRGLTPANLARFGLDAEPPLFLLASDTKLRPDLRLTVECAALPNAFTTVVADLAWTRKLASGWTVVPAVRLLRQFDQGAGRIGGAALSGVFAADKAFTSSDADRRRLASYADPRSLDGGLWAARISLSRGPLAITLGGSSIADQADVVAPWRGFPTGGYTRAMAQIDWLAHSRAGAVRVDWDLGADRVFANLKVSGGLERIDFDDAKLAAGTVSLTDRSVYTFDCVALPRALPRTAFKLRVGLADAEAKPGSRDFDSYREVRVEMNHFY
jgi:hypothetical protein